ncbi:MAG TPA: hypothetical protein PKK40_02885, partial [Marmoricola sp.]|nr:hypothetical protein [Marmoricola sp.]
SARLPALCEIRGRFDPCSGHRVPLCGRALARLLSHVHDGTAPAWVCVASRARRTTTSLMHPLVEMNS